VGCFGPDTGSHFSSFYPPAARLPAEITLLDMANPPLMGRFPRRPLGIYAVTFTFILLIQKTGFYPHLLIPFFLLYLPFFLIRNEKGDLSHFGLEPKDWQMRDLVPILKTSAVILLPYVFFQLFFLHGGVPGRPGSLDRILSLVLIEVFLVALPEEVFFRGYLQTHLEDFFQKRFRLLGVIFGFGMILAAAFFALSHFFLTKRLFSLTVFFPSLVFGWLKERTGGVMAPVIFHALANIVYFFLPFYL
jgi:membrane protease YdiL (CAAX protease family)